MKRLMLNNSFRLCLTLIGGLLLTGCTDSNYDLSNIDGTIGIGSDSLSLPGNNSTTSLMLKDILELKDSDFIKVDKDGYYIFEKTADNTNTSNASVDKVVVSSKSGNGYEYAINLSSAAGSKAKKAAAADAVIGSQNADISVFKYDFTNVPSEIKVLDYANTSSVLTATLKFNKVSTYLKTINTMVLTFPKFLDVASVQNGSVTKYVDANNSVTFTNVTTSSDQKFLVNVKGLNFKATETNANNSLTFANSNIKAVGNVNMAITVRVSDLVSTTSFPTTSLVMNGGADLEQMIITGATGKFSPTFNFDDLGNVTLNDIPNFLSDKDVCIDLYNPQINLNVSSNMPINGKIKGTLISKDANGKQIASVTIPEITVPKNTNSVISIRKQNTPASGDTVVVVASNLSNIIKTIPHTISFTNVTANGDASSTETIDLGKNYTITSKYSMSTPLTFDSNAKIVYRDSVNDWNKSIKDMAFKEENGTINGSIVLTADAINQLPIYLTLSAYAIDKNNDSISTDKISVVVDGTVAATANATNPTTSAIKVTIKPKTNAVFKTLDGLQFRAVGAASDGTNPIVGKRLNERTQSLILKNVKIKKVGQIIYKDSDSE